MSNTSQQQELMLPLHGMNSTSCADHVAKALNEIPGVSSAVVDLKKNQASLSFNPEIVDLIDIRNAVIDAGYSIPTHEVILKVSGMSCVSCLAHVEGTLLNLPGVLEAAVSLRQERATVQFIPEVVTLAQMCSAINDAGYTAHPLDHEKKDWEEEKSSPDRNYKTAESAGLFGWVRKKFNG